MSPLLEFEGIVEKVEKELIPKLHRAQIVSSDKSISVEMDLHEELVVYSQGERLRIGLYREVPEYREGEDLVMVAYHTAYRKVDEETEEHLFSAGGLLFKIRLPSDRIEVEPLQKVYIKVSRI